MMRTQSVLLQDVNDIEQLISQKVQVSKQSLLTFTDRVDFLTDLFTQNDDRFSDIISIGYATPEIMVAADRAEITIQERLAENPFSVASRLLEGTSIPSNAILYIANPNRITGGTFSLKDLRKAVEMIPSGLLLVDEYYFDYFGISALPLLDLYTNLVILRSFTSAFGIDSSDAGFAISSEQILEPLRFAHASKSISIFLRRSILAGMGSDDALSNRMKDIHDESLRLAKSLNSLGVKCRITATDALLFKVKSPKDVGNELTKGKVLVENLDGYPHLSGYMRYRIESFNSNEKLLNCFKRMSKQLYELPSVIPGKQTLRRPAESKKENSVDRVTIGNREDNIHLESRTTKNRKHLFKLG